MKNKTLEKSRLGRRIKFDRVIIKAMRKRGHSLREIAKIMGCSVQTVSISSRL